MPIEGIVVCCGVGTFCLRWLPIWHSRRRAGGKASRTGTRLARCFDGIGVAALSALCVLSLREGVLTVWDPLRTGAVVAGMLVIYGVRRGVGGIAIPVVCGTCAYVAWMMCLS